ncbi:MAG: peptide chain release factor N(5)-glutamine methyltransferase [Anaerolineales bacterium]|nr:peptide chain release factor N(5)-glutamine methyltransferase [Anaerolineales bacterium]
MTSLGNILEKAIHRLSAVGCDTPRLDAEVLLAHNLGRERTWLYLHPSDSLDENQEKQFEELLHRREQREPVAYIIGHKEFFGLEFQVNPHVLIPRPDTELLVETAIKWSIINNQLSIVNRKFTIVDVGTGSGCIAVALAKHTPDLSIIAVDTSPEALRLARLNAEQHAVADRITFLSGDLLELLLEPVDLIVSNPPYVSQPELAAAMPEVSKYEPRLALDGGPDGLEVIRRLLSQAREKLARGGSLLVEIGSGQGQVVFQLAHSYFPKADIQIKQDLAGLDRLLVVQM